MYNLKQKPKYSAFKIIRNLAKGLSGFLLLGLLLLIWSVFVIHLYNVFNKSQSDDDNWTDGHFLECITKEQNIKVLIQNNIDNNAVQRATLFMNDKPYPAYIEYDPISGKIDIYADLNNQKFILIYPDIDADKLNEKILVKYHDAVGSCKISLSDSSTEKIGILKSYMNETFH